MKIAVCLKQVVTREWHVRANDAGDWVRDEDAAWELNEPDAYALEAALRLREQHGGDVLAVSAGPDRVTRVLREALSRGADQAVHVTVAQLANADPSTTASALAAAIAPENVDLILTGLQSSDLGFAQVGVLLAAQLGFSHATIVMDVQLDADRVRVKRELEGGWFQWVDMPRPAVLTIQSGINQLRYATLKGIMAAKKKEIRVVAVPRPSVVQQRIVSVYPPRETHDTQMIAGTAAEAARDLVSMLRDKARVI